MNIEKLIEYYGTYDVIVSPADIFKFTLNPDRKTANVSLSETVDVLSLSQIAIPYKCEIDGETYIITVINDNAFSSCSNLRSVIIPNSIKTIGSCAFESCISLENIKIPKSVIELSNDAFLHCIRLISIDVDEANEIFSSVQGVLFDKNLTQLILYPINKKKITYEILDSVTIINNHAFLENVNLKNISMSDKVITIGEEAFRGCTQLEYIRLSNNLSTLESCCFYGCINLKVIIIPQNVQTIKTQCFSNCNKLKKIIVESKNLIVETELETFPVDNEDMEIFVNFEGEFKDNELLKPYISVWDKYDGLYYCSNNEIDRIVFYDSNLINNLLIVFNQSVRNNGLQKQIDEDAFFGCDKLKTLEINESCVIKTNAFIDCKNLTDVFVNTGEIYVEKNVFPTNNLNFTIYVNSNSNLISIKELQPYLFLFKENMASYNSHLFVAGVGEVELFKGKDVVLSSKTLIDTGINLTVNLDDIQGNGGAKLYGKYASQAGMTLKFTDAMFRMEFLAANLGEDIEIGGSAIEIEPAVVRDGMVIINGEPLSLCLDSDNVIVWIGKQDNTGNFIAFFKENIEKGEEENFGKTIIKDVPFPNGTSVCVKYIKEYEDGQTIKVSSNYLPDEMTAILTASLFAGNQNSLENATKIGTLTITIPRLMLNGNTEISMNMAGFSQMNIEGQALAVDESECDEGGYYAIISKVIKNSNWTSNLAGLAIDNANHLKRNDVLNVYGVFYGIGTRPLTKSQYVVLPSNCIDKNGIITYSGNEDLMITVILKDDSSKITRGIIEIN